MTASVDIIQADSANASTNEDVIFLYVSSVSTYLSNYFIGYNTAMHWLTNQITYACFLLTVMYHNN